MNTISKDQLDKIIADHKLWLRGNPNGVRADLRGAILRDVKLDYVNLWRADFSGADLAGSSFKNAELTAVDFSYANLSDANLSHASGHLADFRSANLRGANLFSAKFEAADFSSADFNLANLKNTNLRSAVLRGANLCGAHLRAADLSGADLAQSCGLVYAQAAWSDHGELGSRMTAAVIDYKVWYFCGGFQGTESALRQYIEDGAEKYRASRTKAVDFVSSCIAENLK